MKHTFVQFFICVLKSTIVCHSLSTIIEPYDSSYTSHTVRFQCQLNRQYHDCLMFPIFQSLKAGARSVAIANSVRTFGPQRSRYESAAANSI